MRHRIHEPIPGIKFVRDGRTTADDPIYRVLRNGRKIGYVWRYTGFSYRGMDGWNAGIRIEDFHPVEWAWSRASQGVFAEGKYKVSRHYATVALLEAVKKRTPLRQPY